MRALILSGAGRYADPWHPFAETSGRIADILRGSGFDVEVSEAVDARMAALAYPHDSPEGLDADPDLLVLNIGDPALTGTPDPEAEELGRAGLLAYLARGGRLLASHVSSTSLRGVPEWEDILGGVWVRGATFHPDYGRARIHVHPERHHVVAGLDDFEVDDERYTDLRVAADVVPLASHEHEGAEHPLIWARTYGPARVFYDALGHDAASYESPTHREILRRAALWLTA
ncbi:ThuA domain-containing protein [Leifsonia virtsii]|uniref:ThuA domain-containing protein n=1 Tax=Leifsonia virtsii TaxID=3035915 RepID=A0ABT8J1N6_9MICO|nr:ThuA domain-containing protein [Leifsonia virtsii]MDN4598998.1 ThuA domain-containing protein [Leifsonia virtsii]